MNGQGKREGNGPATVARGSEVVQWRQLQVEWNDPA